MCGFVVCWRTFEFVGVCWCVFVFGGVCWWMCGLGGVWWGGGWGWVDVCGVGGEVYVGGLFWGLGLFGIVSAPLVLLFVVDFVRGLVH